MHADVVIITSFIVPVGGHSVHTTVAMLLQVNLPSWVNFPDFERVGWLNSVLGKSQLPKYLALPSGFFPALVAQSIIVATPPLPLECLLLCLLCNDCDQ